MEKIWARGVMYIGKVSHSRRHRFLLSLLLAVILVFQVTGCAANGIDHEEVDELKANLKHIADNVYATDVIKKFPETRSNEELLKASVQHDSTLMAPFDNYSIRARREDNATSVMMCNKSQTMGLLEDTSCTSQFDHTFAPDSPCEFKLDIATLCK